MTECSGEVTTFRKVSYWSEVLFVFALCLMLVVQPALVNAQTVPDTSIPANAPQMDTAPNGVPVVNIVKPSVAGVSLNKFTEYNVGSQGLILNNNANFGTSQLGGVLLANPKLGGQEANIIVNQVTGGNQSQLGGFTEVFGHKAQLVIANPNGITCSGCGFINTSRTTLTTGSPQMSGGSLVGIDVNGNGSVAIEGSGLNATASDALDILARTIRLNAPINAKDLKVFAGRNIMDYGARTVTAKADDGSTKPALAIDGTLFGAMYADRISVLATEDGVGVKIPADMATGNGDLSITADGRIEVKDATSTGSITIQSGSSDVAFTGDVNAGDKLSAQAANGSVSTDAGSVVGALNRVETISKSLSNNGDLIAGLDSNGNGTATGALNVQTTETLSNIGTLESGDTLNLNAGSIDSTGTIRSQNTNNATASGNLSVTTVASTNGSTLTSNAGNVTVSGTVNGGGSLNLNAANGSIAISSGATVGALNTVGISAKNIMNAGEVAAGLGTDGNANNTGSLSLSASQLLTNTGILSSGDTLSVEADQTDNNEGAILSIGNMQLAGVAGAKASSIQNRSGAIETSNGNITIKTYDFQNKRKSASTSSVKIFDQTYYETPGDPPSNPPGAGISQAGWWYLVDGSTVVVPHPQRGMAYASYYDFGPIRVQQYQRSLGSASASAIVSSGGDLTIVGGNISNTYSAISANGNISMVGTSLNNTQLNLTRDLYFTGPNGSYNRCIGGPCQWFGNGGGTLLVESIVYDSLPATIQAGGTITGDFLGQVNNTTIVASADPGNIVHANRINGSTPYTPSNGQIDLLSQLGQIPGSSALIQQAPPTSKYVYESRAKFADLGTFFGGDYFLSRVNVDFDKIPDKFAMDAALETRVVRDAVWMETGKRWLDPAVMDASAQMKALIDGAATLQGTLNLTVGVALTEDQMAALTKDIVWYVTEEVNGRTVLVPRVYLANARKGDLSPNGASIVANDISLSGTEIYNGGDIRSDTDATLEALTGDIVNDGGTIEAANDIKMTAAGDIVHQTASREISSQPGDVTTFVGREGKISAGGTVTMDAGGNIQITGADTKAGTDIDLTAGGDINVTALAVRDKSGSVDKINSDEWDRTTQRGSTLEAGGNLSLKSGQDAYIAGSRLSAGNDLTVEAENNVIVTSLADTVEESAQRRGTKSLDAQHQSVKNVSSWISAGGNLVVKAKNEDVILRASVLKSGGQTTIDAQNGSVALLSAKDSDNLSIKSSSMGGLWFKTRDAGHVEETVQMVKITPDGGLVINAGNGIVVEYRDTGNLDESVDALSQQPGLEWMGQVKQRNDATWHAIEEAHKQWDYKSQGLSGAAATVIAIAVGIATYGAASSAGSALASQLGLTTAGGELTTAGSVVSSAAAAGLSSLAGTASLSLINNKGNLAAVFKELASSSTLKSLATAMVSAGLTSGITGAINSAAGETLINSNPSAPFMDRLAYQSIQTSVTTLAQATVGGQDIGGALKSNLLAAAVNAASSVAFKAIGDFAQGEGISDGDIRKVILHATAGCAVGQMSGQNCMAGAIGAGLQELAGDAYGAMSDDPSMKIKIAGLASALATALAGGGAEAVNTAANVAQLANTYNRQLHTQEISALRQKAAELAGTDNRSEDEWLQVLSREALRRVDANAASNLESIPEDQAAIAVLDQMIQIHGDSFVDGMGRQVGFLTKQQGYFENTALYADQILRNSTFYDTAFQDYAPRDLQQLKGVVSPAVLMTADAMRYSSFGAILANTDQTAGASPEEQMKQLVALERNSQTISQITGDINDRKSDLEAQLALASEADKPLIQSQINGLELLKVGMEQSTTSFSQYKWKIAQQGANEGYGDFIVQSAEDMVKVAQTLATFEADVYKGAFGDDEAASRTRQRMASLVWMVTHANEIPAEYVDALRSGLAEAAAAYENGDLRGGTRKFAAVEAEVYSTAVSTLLSAPEAMNLASKGFKAAVLALEPDIKIAGKLSWETVDGVQSIVDETGTVFKLTDQVTSDGRPIFETEFHGTTIQTTVNTDSGGSMDFISQTRPALENPTPAQIEASQQLGLDPRWLKSDGTPDWPPNDGFLGSPNNDILQPGTLIDRYGNNDGRYLSPAGTPFEQRALPPNSNGTGPRKFIVLKPLPVKSGKAAPWFGQPGGGLQYKIDEISVKKLIKDGYIKEVLDD